MPGVGETTYYYDFENRLTTINLPTSQLINFTYDGDKRRTSKTVDFTSQTTTTKFFYDGINILKDLDGNGAVKASYVQGIGIDKLIYVSEWVSQTDQNISYYHSDALGSVRSLTDDSGTVQAAYSYDAWGNINEQTGTSDNEYKFTSRRWEEEIGLQYNRARFYDPEIGRFTTPDPLTGGPDDPTISYRNNIYAYAERKMREYTDSLEPHRRLNRYVYCANNPVSYTDPLGLVRWKDAIEASAAIVVDAVVFGFAAWGVVTPEPATTIAGFAGMLYVEGCFVLHCARLANAIADKPSSPNVPEGIVQLGANISTHKASPETKEVADKLGQAGDLALDLAIGRLIPTSGVAGVVGDIITAENALSKGIDNTGVIIDAVTKDEKVKEPGIQATDTESTQLTNQAQLNDIALEQEKANREIDATSVTFENTIQAPPKSPPPSSPGEVSRPSEQPRDLPPAPGITVGLEW